MPARVFYPIDDAAPYVPATIRGTWDDTSEVLNKHLSRSKKGSRLSTNVLTSATVGHDELHIRLVSDALAAQTISGTIDTLAIFGDNGQGTHNLHLHAFVTAGDSDTVRGTLLSDFVGTEIGSPTTLPVGIRLESPQTLSSVICSSGDRLVIEIGLRRVTGSLSNVSYYRGGTGIDGLEGEHQSGIPFSSSCSWIAFSNPIFFSGETVAANAATQMGSSHQIDSGGSQTVTLPPLVSDGHLLLAFVSIDGTSAAPVVDNAWDFVTGPINGNGGDSCAYLYARIANDEPESYFFSTTIGAGSTVCIVAYSGMDTLDPIESIATSSPASGTSPLSGSVTTIGTNRTIVWFMSGDLETAAITQPANMNFISGAGTGSTTVFMAADKVEASAGSYSYTASLSVAEAVVVALVALTPSGAGSAFPGRLAQIATEVLGNASDPAARLAQYGVEALVAASDPAARFALMSVEILAGPQTGSAPPPSPGGKPGPGKGNSPNKPKNRPFVGGNSVARKIRLGSG